MYYCIKKFLDEPTYTSVQILAQKEASFPALTVCPDHSKAKGSKSYKLNMLQRHGIPTVENYNHYSALDGKLTWKSNYTNVSEAELFNLVTYKKDELFKQVYVRFIHSDVSI